jgi:[acyl-carrier-protein] S-malonyltransferase
VGRASGRLPLSELDAADRLEPGIHLAPANVSPLIWLASLFDAERAATEHEIVAVIGNSLGWYTALTVAGALSFDDGYRLVQEISLLQQSPSPDGGQIVYPLTDADWQPVDELMDAVTDALAAGDDQIYPSIELGGYVVLAGSEAGITRLLAELPPVTVGERLYPMRLALHGPYHTPLVAHVAEAARRSLADLEFRAPHVTLIDGRGRRHSPWSADPTKLHAYTLGEQLVMPYRFATSVHVALREHAPDALVLSGPGNTLGGICGQIVVAEGYRGIRSRAAFDEVQRGPDALVISMQREGEWDPAFGGGISRRGSNRSILPRGGSEVHDAATT